MGPVSFSFLSACHHFQTFLVWVPFYARILVSHQHVMSSLFEEDLMAFILTVILLVSLNHTCVSLRLFFIILSLSFLSSEYLFLIFGLFSTNVFKSCSFSPRQRILSFFYLGIFWLRLVTRVQCTRSDIQLRGISPCKLVC